MTRRSCRAWAPILTALLAAASQAGAGEPKTYRWVGEDGHVYTSTTPPPNGKGVIDAQPATPAKTKSPARKTVPAQPAASAAAQREASQEETPSCTRFQGMVDEWRMAKRSLAAAEAYLDQLQSDTDHYVRRNDSYYETRLEGAENRVTAAEEKVNQLESDAARAGAPQSCFTE